MLQKQANSLVLFGLTLSSAAWDQARSSLVPLPAYAPASKDSYCAMVSFRLGAEPHSRTPTPGRRAEVKDHQVQFNCPVLLANRITGDTTLGASHRTAQPLFHIPLALSAELGPLEGAKVYLSCDSEYHDAYM